MTLRWHFLATHLDLPAASGVDDARWEYFQYKHLTDDSVFRIENKARQIAWSFVIAAEAVAFALLDDEFANSSIFESINLDEASEKINYARAVLENLKNVPFQTPRVVKDNSLELKFSNGATIISLPARPPRGKARRNFYGDEFAHVKQDKAIYQAALPVISKGGRVRLGSSPFGSRGVFWEVFTESMRRYPDYTRKKTPWWEIFSFCTDVPDAVRNAPMLPTAERIERYGKTRVRTIYDNMTLEDFQQEYECHFGAESLTLLSWETVLGMQDDALDCAQVRITGNDVLPAIDAIDRVAHKVKTGVLEQSFFLGLDVGRTKDATEIMLVGASDSSSSLPLRLSVTLINTEFDRQFDVLRSLLKRLPVTFGMLDRTGIGYYLAERTTGEFPEQVIGVDFTNLSKRTWATYLKTQAERGNITIPTDRELAYQLHSVKRIVTADKNLKFDNAPTDKHHADKFWALALALAAYRSGQNEYVSSSTTYA